MMRCTGLLAVTLLVTGPAFAQAPDTVENDPIRCWWRTSSGAVRIGETFALVLTCAVLDTDAIRVVPDESRLPHSVIQLAPFDVTDGTHPPDLRSGQRRFFQYEYTLRALGSDLIGQDVPLPNLSINYRVNSRLPGNAALEGRDLNYLLPAHAVRIVSMVPSDAGDIRDTPDITFDRLESLRFREGVLNIMAITLVALGSLMAVVALVAALRRKTPALAAEGRMLGDGAILAAAARELSAAERGGDALDWSDQVLDRALTATRLAGAVATGRRISQGPAAEGAESGEGRLVIRRLRRGARVSVSSSVTAEDLKQALQKRPARDDSSLGRLIEELRAALSTLTAAQYARSKTRDTAAISTAVASAAAAARALKSRRLWPRQQVRRWVVRTPAAGRT